MKYSFEDLKDQVAIITGSGQGIGKAIAKRLAEHGTHVVITDINPETAAATAAEIREMGVETLDVVCDVSKKEDIDAMFQAAMDKWGTVDILVNNAGITMDGLFIRMKQEQWQKVIDINLTGVYLCAQAASNIMRKNRKGNIINVSSIAAQGNPGQANYSSSKAGVIGLTKTLAKELAPLGIRCNAIAPGFIHTPMTDKIPEKYKEKILENIPLKRIGEPEEVANAILFLASNMASYISGHILNINGGIGGL